jgi:hypothetical protein
MKTRTAIILAIATTPTAFGNMILSSANFVSGTGLGTEPTLLTLQDSPTEIGCVGSTSSQTGSTFNASGVCGGSSADVKTGGSQIGPQAIGTITANTFGIVFNADQAAGGPITLTGLTASFYDSTGKFLYQTSGLSCAQAGVPNCAFTNTSSGVGKSGYLFALDAAQQQAAAAAGAFSSPTNLVGLSASASGANAGPDTFYLANVPGGVLLSATPEPSTLALGVAGLVLVSLSLHSPRRKRGQ